MYRPTREGDFLYDLLKGFHGVLVSDYYAAYDSLAFPQQKCLLHLMRDMNQELLNNPTSNLDNQYDPQFDQWSIPIGDDKGWIIYGIVNDARLVILLRFLPGLD